MEEIEPAEGDWTCTSSNAAEAPLPHSADMRASSEDVAHPLPKIGTVLPSLRKDNLLSGEDPLAQISGRSSGTSEQDRELQANTVLALLLGTGMKCG